MSYLLPLGRINADYYQTPHTDSALDPAAAVIQAFTAATTSIHFAIYSLTHEGIADALIAAHLRGVTVLGVADAESAKASYSRVRTLGQAGIDVRVWGGAYRLMHDKVFVTDAGTRKSKAGLGSFNWTNQAEKVNVEVLLIARGVQVTRGLGPALVEQITTVHDRGAVLP